MYRICTCGRGLSVMDILNEAGRINADALTVPVNYG